MVEEKKCKHLVISGGGITGFSYYGALKESSKRNVWNIDNIKTIYGTSIGSILACMLALKYDWEVLDNYIINRPWQHIFKYDMYTILDSIQNRGIFTVKVIEETFEPLLAGKDLNKDITLLEFYEWSGIEIHIISIELLSFKLIDFSHKTHPEWRLVDAIYCSSSLPVVMSPFYKDSCIYCDGGFLSNYPVIECIKNGADPSEIMGIARILLDNDKVPEMTEESNLLDYIITLISKICENIVLLPKLQKINIEYIIPSTPLSISNIFKTVNSIEERERLIKIGVDYVTEHCYVIND
jgi:predicted acylesterase/phospholipase RssA